MKYFILILFYSGMALALETPCVETNNTTEINSSLFRQTWSIQQNNYPGDGSFAMWCDGETCDIAKPIKRTNRAYVIKDRTIILNYGMNGHEVEEIQIIDLTDRIIKLKFPSIDEVQTFYRAK